MESLAPQEHRTSLSVQSTTQERIETVVAFDLDASRASGGTGGRPLKNLGFDMLSLSSAHDVCLQSEACHAQQCVGYVPWSHAACYPIFIVFKTVNIAFAAQSTKIDSNALISCLETQHPPFDRSQPGIPYLFLATISVMTIQDLSSRLATECRCQPMYRDSPSCGDCDQAQ